MPPDPTSEVAALLLKQRGCVTRQQARDAGLSDDEVRERLRSGTWRSVHRGVLRDTHNSDPLWQLRAALLTQTSAPRWPAGLALSHSTAAGLFGFEGVPPDRQIHLVVPRTWAPDHRSGAVRLHRCRTPRQHIESMYGVPVTSAAWTALSLARVLQRRQAVAVADAALRSGWCSLTDLRDALPLLAGLRGCVQARQVVDLARDRTDSCQETLTRLILLDGGLPEPDVDMHIVDEHDRVLARGDLGYRSKLIWLEYDGFAVHTDRDVFRRDRTRQNWLVSRGWFVLRYTDADVYRAEHQIVRDAAAALRDAPGRIAALRPGLSPEADEARRILGR